MEVDFLLRIRSALEAATAQPSGRPGQPHAKAYPRLRAEVEQALTDDLRDEFERLFPSSLETTGQPWGKQGEEAIVLMTQLAGWLNGLVEAAILDRRIRAEAEERAKRTGFA